MYVTISLPEDEWHVIKTLELSTVCDFVIKFLSSRIYIWDLELFLSWDFEYMSPTSETQQHL